MPDEPGLSVDLGGVSVNDHTLADARLACDAWLDQTLARNIAVLAEAGATTLETVAQGGHAATRQRGRAPPSCTRTYFGKRWPTNGLRRNHQPLELADGVALDLPHPLG